MKIKGLKKKLKFVIGFLLITVFLLVTVIAIALNFIFTPEKLTPQVLKVLNENLNGEVRCESIEATFFSSFPHFGIRLKDGVLLQTVNRVSSNDTIVSFSDCDASINITKLLFQKSVDVKEVSLQNPKVYIYLNKEGVSNVGNIIKTDSADISEEESSFEIKNIFLRNVSIHHGDLHFVDESTLLKSTAEDLNVRIKASDTPDEMILDFQADTRSVMYQYNGVVFIKNLKTKVHSDFYFNKKNRLFTFQSSSLRLNDIDFIFSGKLKGNKKKRNVEVDLQADLKVPSLNTIWKMLPKEYIDTKEADVQGKGNIIFVSKGNYGAGELPVAIIDLSIENGAVSHKKFPGKVNLLETKAKAYIDFKSDENTYIDISRLNLNATGISATGSVMIKQPYTNALIDAKIEADANLSKIKSSFPIPKEIELSGTTKLKLDGSVDWKSLSEKNFNTIELNGNARFSDFHVSSVKDTLDVGLKNASLECSRPGKDKDKASLHLTLSDLRANLKQQHYVHLTKFSVHIARGKQNGKNTTAQAEVQISKLNYSNFMHQELKTENATVNLSLASLDFSNPVLNGNILLKDAYVSSPIDSVTLKINAGSIALSRTGPEKTTANLHLSQVEGNYQKMHQVQLKMADVNLVKGKRGDRQSPFDADLKFQKFHYTSTTGDRMYAGTLVATAKIRPGETFKTPDINTKFTADSLFVSQGKNYAGIKKGNYDLQLQHDKKEGWQPKGYVDFDYVILNAAEFGMPVKLLKSRVTLDGKRISLDNANLVFGQSDIFLSGYLQNLLPKDNSTTTGKLTVSGKYINANELMVAMQRGQQLYSEYEKKDSTLVVAPLKIPESEKTLFEIPKNLAFDFQTRLDKVHFGNLDIQDVQGDLKVEDGHLDLTNFSLKTLATDLYLKMRYQPENSKNARLLYSVDMREIEMNKLHELSPVMDTLLPMVKSFEGKADFIIKGTAKLNQNLEVDVNSIHGMASLKAKDIMVLDSETFQDLAKTFMFKSKEKNTIDSLDVEMIIENQQLEILPALLEIDRYRLAVGGIQNFDLTYDYHISVLKSPVPFKMGVDVKGNPDDYDISLGKAKYKYYFTDKERLKDKADTEILEKQKSIEKIISF